LRVQPAFLQYGEDESVDDVPASKHGTDDDAITGNGRAAEADIGADAAVLDAPGHGGHLTDEQ